MELIADMFQKLQNFFVLFALRKKGFGYKGSTFRRVIANFMCQGSDFTSHNGTDGKSIYGAKCAGEKYKLKHIGPATVFMTNAGQNTNGFQFFLCMVKFEWLDVKHVVFGKVDECFDAVKNVENFRIQSGQTSRKIEITDNGQC